MLLTKKLWLSAVCMVGVILMIGIITATVGCNTPAETVQPAATAASAPSPTVTECPTSEEQEYLDAVQSDLRRLGTLTTMMSEDLVRPTENLHLYEDDLWRMTMENHFYVLQASADALLEHDPPASATSLQGLIERMVGDYKSGMVFYKAGIANLDADMLIAGDDELTLATDDVRQIGAQVESFCQIRGR